MTDHKPLLFNPQRATTRELEGTFVRNWPLVDSLEKALKEDQDSETPRHWQIVGPRGSGKTHLTEILARRMREKHHWNVLRIPEEHYGITTVSRLLREIVNRLKQQPRIDASGRRDPHSEEDLLLDQLRAFRSTSGQPILVILENLPLLLDQQLRRPNDQARIRELLTHRPAFTLLATAVAQPVGTLNYDAPLYDFFQTISLDDFSQDDLIALVEARAKWDGEVELISRQGPVRQELAAIYHLSGGNPRLAVALYQVLRQGVTDELHSHLLQLLDEVTPYYQARLHDVSPQAAQLLVEMATAPGPVLPSRLARNCGLPTNQVTAQLRKLQDERFVTPGGRRDRRSRFYEIKDRLFRIWLQMREDQAGSARIRFITEFFQRWYGPGPRELQQAAARVAEALWEDLGASNEARCSDHLLTLAYLREALASHGNDVVLRTVIESFKQAHDDASLALQIPRLRGLYERSTTSADRECLGLLLGEALSHAGLRDDSINLLRGLLEDGFRSGRVAEALIKAMVDAGSAHEAADLGHQLIKERGDSEMDPFVVTATALASIAAGDVSEGLRLGREVINGSLCGGCRERISRELIAQLAASGADIEAMGVLKENAGVDVTTEEAKSLLIVAARGASARADDFRTAARCFGDLSKAPTWFLGSGVCGLAHDSKQAAAALSFVEALAEKRKDRLPQAALDHLVQIAAMLNGEFRAEGAKTRAKGRRGELVERALRLLENKSTPAALAKAFRFVAPSIARHSRMKNGILPLYTMLRERGLISEDISPYGEAVAVSAASDRDKEMMTLHPEVRDAVSLLLSEEREVNTGDTGKS